VNYNHVAAAVLRLRGPVVVGFVVGFWWAMRRAPKAA